MIDKPYDKSSFKKAWPKFREFLLARGSAIYEPTNEYELARFLTQQGVGIVYMNGKEVITHWTNGAVEAFDAYRIGGAWQAVKRIKRGKKTMKNYAAIVKRDGLGCFYCMKELSPEEASIEHFIPIASGGGNHLSNKGLACYGCNKEAGHMSVKEKLELAISKRKSA
jgi:hypothetical protein